MIIKTISVKKINPASYNPRKTLKPDDRQYKQLVKSLNEFGFVEPLIWNCQTGNLVGGHQRFNVLMAQGVKEVEVSVVDLSEDKEKALNIALNKISGDWDKDKLAEIIDELVKTPEIDIESVGFELPEAEQLIADILGDIGSDENADVLDQLDTNLPAITKPGDLIELGLDGKHRVLCGDVTKPAGIFVIPSGRVSFTYRPEIWSDSKSVHTERNTIALPHWIRLTRQGNQFIGEHSHDGEEWEIVQSNSAPNIMATTKIEMPKEVYIGLAAMSHEGPSVTAEAKISNVQVIGSVTPDGPFIESKDIGFPTFKISQNQ
jgi:hypothetical protein